MLSCIATGELAGASKPPPSLTSGGLQRSGFRGLGFKGLRCRA